MQYRLLHCNVIIELKNDEFRHEDLGQLNAYVGYYKKNKMLEGGAITSYYDKENKRKKQIDLDKPHQVVLPHTHHGYEHRENDGPKGYGNLTPKEVAMVERVNKAWKEKKDVVWTRWKNSN